MGRGKEKNVIEYCIDDITLQQVIGEKGLIKIKEYILNHDASCPPKRFTNSSDKRYLTHPEGVLKEKREAPNKVLVNMKGDSNTPPRQRKLFEAKGINIQTALICNPGSKEETWQKNAQKNIKSTDCSPSSKKKITNVGDLKCPCPVGKIIHSDTVAQTDQLHQKKNKKISILTRSTAFMQPKVKCDAVKTDTSTIKSIQQKIKSDTACPCLGKKLSGLKSMLQKQSKKRQKLKRRRRTKRTFSIWSQKENDEVCPVKLKSYKQTKTKSRSVSPHCPKLKETAKLPKGITEVRCSCPSKKNICAREICAEAYECKSLIDVKKLKSLIKCVCKKSKNMLSKKKPSPHQPVCEPEVCNKILKATKIDNQKGEAKRASKKKNKNLPKETETRERFIAIPENACDGTGDLIIRIKNPSNIKTKNVVTEQDKCSQMNTNQNKSGCQTGGLLLKIKDRSNIKNKKIVNKSGINKTIGANPKNAGYQSGEPLQIQVDPMNRCILNPDEIKYKLMNLSQVKGKTYVCPSRNAGQEVYEGKNFIQMNSSQLKNTTCVCPTGQQVCEGKICQKMFKDKKTNFNCKCQHIKDIGVECNDRTCGSKLIKRKYNKCSKLCVEQPKLTEPQFEVQLDAKRMCILNSDEVNKKIIEKEAEVYETCPSGTCAAACEKGNIYKCRCVQKRQDIGECTNRTCVDTETEKQAVDLWYYLISKLLSKVPVSSKTRMRRSPFDTNEIKKIKSVFSLIRERLKRTPEIWDGSEATKKTSCSLSGLKPQQKYVVNYSNYHRRSGLKLPLQRSRQIRTSTTRNVAQPKSSESSSPSSCGCSKELEKEKKNKNKKKEKKKKQKKDNSKTTRKMRKEMARQKKLERRKAAKEEKELKEEMLSLEKVDEAGDTNCLADCILGTLGIGLGIIQCFLMSMFKMITKPKKSFATIREWMKEPKQTSSRVQKWIKYKWRVQKFRMSRSIKGSDTMTTILDEVKESKYYKTFASKGKTDKERQAIESQTRRRQRRMRQKASRALHGCRDILLLTMRKTPWLCVYHICPDFYPRCLGLRRSFIQVLQLLMFCCAIVVWTPCILCMELCRGFMCCITCSTM